MDTKTKKHNLRLMITVIGVGVILMVSLVFLGLWFKSIKEDIKNNPYLIKQGQIWVHKPDTMGNPFEGGSRLCYKIIRHKRNWSEIRLYDIKGDSLLPVSYEIHYSFMQLPDSEITERFNLYKTEVSNGH